MERAVGGPIDFFAYPKGSFNPAVAVAVKNSGYRAAFGTLQRLVDKESDLYGVPRVQIDQTTSFLEFKAKLTRAADWYEKIWKILN